MFYDQYDELVSSINTLSNMALPKFDDFFYPFLLVLEGKTMTKREIREEIIKYFELTEEDCHIKTKGGGSYAFDSRLNFTRQYLRRALMIDMPSRGIYRVTERGIDYLLNHNSMSKADLMAYPEFAEYANGTAKFEDEPMENWQEFIEIFQDQDMENISSDVLMLLVESFLRTLGWKKSNGSMRLVTTSDSKIIQKLILFNHPSSNYSFCVVPTASDTDENLIHELKEIALSLNSPIVLVIGKAISLYQIVDQNNDQRLASVCDFEYDEDSIDGAAVCNRLIFSDFSYSKLEKFCEEKAYNSSDKKRIRETLLSWTHDTSEVMDLIKQYLVELGYDESDVTEELSYFSFHFSLTQNSQQHKSENHLNSKDTTKYSIDGGNNFYNKRRFVLEVVKKYIQDNPTSTLEDLENRFPSEIISKTRGVIRPLSLVKTWMASKPDIRKRFFMEDDEIITLKDGTKVVVHNQWGDSFPNFLRIAKKLYHVISDNEVLDADYKHEEESESSNNNQLKDGIQIPYESLHKFTHK